MRDNLNFEGYDTPGAPLDGADFIEIGWSEAITNGTVLRFDGASAIKTSWHVIPADSTGVTTGAHADGNILYSGHIDGQDNFLIFPVRVPRSGNRTLSFDTMYNIETGWDFGFTQVTTDTAGATGWTSLPMEGTTSDSEDGADPIIEANVPGFSGASGETRNDLWKTVTYNLEAYAGQDILLAFRYATDSSHAGAFGAPPNPGWYIDNIKVGGTKLYEDQATIPTNAESIYEARGLGYTFRLRLVTFADKNGDAIDDVIEVPVDAEGNTTFNLSALTNRPTFNEGGERIVALVSGIAPPAQSDLIGAPGNGTYTLTGLPPTLYTSRARAIGTSFNTSLRAPRVYPGGTFTMTVTVDNLGRNNDLQASPSNAYVAVPIPANTTFVPDTLGADIASDNITYTVSLRDIDPGLPEVPGVYWHGVVTTTADLSFELRAAEPLAIGTVITPTAHFANAPFGTNPSQRFTDIQTPVEVVSPFSLSNATAQPSVQLGSTATFTYTLLNTDRRNAKGNAALLLAERHRARKHRGRSQRPNRTRANRRYLLD